MEPAEWWSMYARHLPILSSIASRVLAQRLLQLRVLTAKRNSSIYDQVKNDHRCRMKHATADRLTYLHESYQLMYRLQDAGLYADVEPWDRDSNSVIATILMQSARPIFCGSRCERIHIVTYFFFFIEG